MGGSDFSRTQSSTHGESKIGAIFAIPEMSAQIVAAEEPITYNQGMLSHLRFGKSDTLSASIDTTFFIALVGLNLCEVVHNPILQAGRLNLQSTKSLQRQHTNPGP